MSQKSSGFESHSYWARAKCRTNYIGSIIKNSKRIVFKVNLINKDKNGQLLLIPEITVNTYWTNLEIDPG